MSIPISDNGIGGRTSFPSYRGNPYFSPLQLGKLSGNKKPKAGTTILNLLAISTKTSRSCSWVAYMRPWTRLTEPVEQPCFLIFREASACIFDGKVKIYLLASTPVRCKG